MQRILFITIVALSAGLGCLAQSPLPTRATDLPGKPYSILKKWTIGGEGSWDYLAFDANALQLFVAHETVVQVVDVTTGQVVGTVNGLNEAHDIALDDNGQFGYVTDGKMDEIHVFDRRTFEVVKRIPAFSTPGSIAFDPATHLVFAICPTPQSLATRAPRATANNARQPRTAQPASGNNPANPAANVGSAITVIDALTNTRLGDVMVSGQLGFARADGKGLLFVNVVDRGQVMHFDTQTVGNLLRNPDPDGAPAPAPTTATAAASTAAATSTPAAKPAATRLDWSDGTFPQGQSPLRRHRIGGSCTDPAGLAIDSDHLRLFVACGNRKLEVLNSSSGELVATLDIGAGSDAIAYDSNRGLIYVANGAGVGSLTIVRQNVTDSYAVIQDLPTEARARTLAVNPQSGEVYLVTALQGYDLTQPGTGAGMHTLPVVNASAVHGSFQVLVVGTGENN